MTNHEDLHRDMGRMEGRLDAMERGLVEIKQGMNEGFDRIHSELKSMREETDSRVKPIEARELERKGAWKVIALVASGVGAGIATLVNFLIGKVH